MFKSCFVLNSKAICKRQILDKALKSIFKKMQPRDDFFFPLSLVWKPYSGATVHMPLNGQICTSLFSLANGDRLLKRSNKAFIQTKWSRQKSLKSSKPNSELKKNVKESIPESSSSWYQFVSAANGLILIVMGSHETMRPVKLSLNVLSRCILTEMFPCKVETLHLSVVLQCFRSLG